MDDDEEELDSSDAVIIAALGGAAADAVAAGQGDPLSDDEVEDDWARAKMYAEEQSDSPEVAGQLLETCWQQSLDLARRHWSIIDA